MKRRELLKNIGLGTVGVAVSGNALANDDLRVPNVPLVKRITTIGDSGDFTEPANGKQAIELAYDQALMEQQFFDEHEMATIAVLTDIIIPADKKSGSATDAGVPDFIEFIVKDMPQHQVPIRGGLMWLDAESKKLFGERFIETSAANRLKLVDMIAYPEQAKPEYSQGVKFFNHMRDLTATGFYTSEIGVQDLGYMGNQPNFWDGVPQDVLDEHGLSYDDWEKHVAKNK